MKTTLILFLILLSNVLFSQTIKGRITDSEGGGLPFITVIDSLSKSAVKSTINGDYQFQIKSDTTHLWFLSEGYEPIVILVTQPLVSNIFNVQLTRSLVEIEGVVINPTSEKDKGKEIMKKVIERRSYFQDLLNEYRCDTYTLSTLKSNIFDSIKKDSVVGIKSEGINEWSAITSYKNNQFKDEFYAVNDHGSKQLGYNFNAEVSISIGANSGLGDENSSIAPKYRMNPNPYLFINGIKDVHFSIFDNTITSKKITENPLISPLAFNAFLYYNFYYKTSFLDSNQNLIHEIEVAPRFDYEALFNGKILIKDEVWEVSSYDFKVNKKVLSYFQDIEIKCNYEKVDSVLVPSSRTFNYLIKDGKKFIEGVAQVKQKSYSFKVEETSKKYWLETATYADDAFDKDSVFWNESRGFPLKSFEIDYINEQDSILTYHESEEYLRKMDSTRNEFTWKNLLFGGWGHVNSFKKYEIQFSPLVGSFQPFGVGGWRTLFLVSYQKEFKNGKIINVKPFINYGNYNKDLKGSFDGAILYNRMNFSKIGFKIGDEYDIIGNTQNVMSSIIPTNRVSNKRFEVNFSRELINGLYLKSDLLISDRKSIDNILYPPWMDSLPEQIFQKPVSFDRYKIFLFTNQFEYHFRQKYTIRKGRKIVYGSPWPVLTFTYKKAIPTIFGSEANFDFVELIIKDDINFNSFGTSNLKFQAGQFLKKTDLRLIEYKYFRRSDYLWFSNPINTMQRLDTSLNTARSYLQFNYIHHFNGFFLNKVWLINRLKLDETIGGGFISIPSAKYVQNEFYLGLERKFRIRKTIFKVGCYAVSNQNNFNGNNIQFKVGLNFYNNFTDKWDY
jgi:hypothetical protein